jgi:rRNA-processing protein FCF1
LNQAVISHHFVGILGLCRLGGTEWNDFFTLRKLSKLVKREMNVTITQHVRSDLEEITQNLKVFLRLFVQLFAELCDKKNERREQVLKHSKNFFDACIDEDGSN